MQYLLSIFLFQLGTIIRLQLQSQSIGNSLRILGGGILVYSLVSQLRRGSYQRLSWVMIFLLIWNTVNILTSILFTGIDLTRTFGEDSYFFNFMLPYLLCYDLRQIPLRKTINTAFIFEIFVIIIIVLNAKYLKMTSNAELISTLMKDDSSLRLLAQIPIMWSIPASIIFMNYKLVDRRMLWCTIFAFTFAIVFSMTFGRRSTSAYGIIFLLTGFCLYLTQTKISTHKRFFLVMAILGIGYAISMFVSHNFAYLMERGLEDTRTGVHNAFYRDMHTIDYIIGRGLNGTYYDPLDIFQIILGKRPGIETGYLNIILHAGCLFLIPYLLICILSAIKGYFYSRNILTKSLALYIFINTLMLIPGSYPAFNLRFFILWIGIMICNNPKVRQMDNNTIAKFYKL